MKKLNLLLCVFVMSIGVFGQVPTPLQQNYSRILFKNGKAHVGNGVVVMDAVVGVVNGKVDFVKNALTYTLVRDDWDTIIDIRGKHIYPGFIAANLTLGLTEIDAVRATRDFDEVGDFNPNIRSLIAYNTDSKVIYTVRTNGVLVTQSTPRGGIISGSSSVMALDGWNWEDAVYKADDGIHLNWPKKYNSSGWWAQPGPSSANEKYAKIRTAIYSFFELSKAYATQKNAEEFSLRFEAMKDIFEGEKRLFIHVDYAPEMNDVIDFSRHFGFKFPVIVGGSDAYLLAERLKENNFSVLLGRPHSLPNFDEDLTYAKYQEAYYLQEAGVLFGIQAAGDMEVMNARNLPFLAGTAWAYGLTEEQAVASISLNIAKILGVQDVLGSIEKGKDATLFVSDGNALDMRSNNVVIAMVKGRFIVLDNHQMQLSHKYHEKYELKE
jgi:imidazolonepropionase-like amidohydrolase